MNKIKIIFLLAASVLFLGTFAQNYVSPEPQNKNAILEEFTGVRCPNCPAGHQVAATILENNPGRAFLVAYHPFGSNFTTPYTGDPDLRRQYPVAFYSTPYCGSTRFMPSAFINREQWANGERIQSRTTWTNYTNQILEQESPLNVGISSTYDALLDILTVHVEVYLTDDVSEALSINVVLSENGLTTQQSGGGSNYMHKHTFREAFTDQWGDEMPTPLSADTYLAFEYAFDNTVARYEMDSCELIAFVYDLENELIISGVGAEVNHGTFVPPLPDFITDTAVIVMGDSVHFSDESICNPASWNWTFEGGTPETSTEQNPVVQYNNYGAFSVTLEVTNEAGTNTITKPGIIQVGNVGLNENYIQNVCSVFPNPTTGLVNIQNSDGATFNKIQIFDLSGSLIEVYNPGTASGNLQLDLSKYQAGLYYVKIMSGNNTYTKKLTLLR